MKAADFSPPPWLRSGHLQTLWANWAPRPARLQRLIAESTTHEVAVQDDRLRVHRWQQGKGRRPVVVVLHGLTGCAASPQVLGVADEGVRAGFDVVRVDLRNASGHTPSRHIGHAGRSEDLLAVIDWTRRSAPGRPIAVAAYSLGGNLALKAFGEGGAALPAEVAALAVISVPVDLDAASRAIDRTSNWPYRWYFLRRLARVVRQRAARFPDLYATIDRRRLASARTLRAFDEAVVATLCGFDDADDYYRRCSAVAHAPAIERPTLLIHADDDPFVPVASYADERLTGNPHLELLLSRHGGHAGFWGRAPGSDASPFWAERRVIEFLRAQVG